MTSIVIVGAGLAGLRAAEAARRADPRARITLLGAEALAPYSRPPLSKGFLKEAWPLDKVVIKPASWFHETGLELMLDSTVTQIERASRRLSLAGGRSLPYDRLVLATGSRPRRLTGPAIDESCVHLLRTAADALRIREAITRTRSLLVIGGGVIGLELAASARAMGVKTTIVEAGERLMARSLPPELSSHLETLHASHGVDLLFGVQLLSVQRSGDAISVATTAGVFVAGCVVAGIGVLPNTELAAAAGLQVQDGIVVDEYGRTSDAAVFAAGEVTRHHNPALGEGVRTESWQIADRQASAAGSTAAGLPQAFSDLPWFWTDQFDMNLQVLGGFGRAARLLRRPASQDGGFVLLGLDGGHRLVGAASVNAGREMSLLKRIAAAASPLDLAAAADPAVPLRELLAASSSMT